MSRERQPDETDVVAEALALGETVRTEVIEHATIESELVDATEVGREIVDTEPFAEEVVGVAIVESTDGADGGAGDDAEPPGDDVVEMSVEASAAGRPSLGADGASVDAVEEGTLLAVEVAETRGEILEAYVVKTIETRVVDEDEELDVEIEGVHRHLLDSDLVRVDGDEVTLGELEIEGAFVEDGEAVQSHLTERATVDREVVERNVLTAEVTDVDDGRQTVTTAELVDRELVGADAVPELHADVDLEVVGDVDAAAETHPSAVEGVAESEGGSETEPDAESRAETAADPETVTDAEPANEERGGDEERGGSDEAAGVDRDAEPEAVAADAVPEGASTAADFDADDVGKDAVLPSGERLGVVSDVEPDEPSVYVEPDRGLTDKLRATLAWGDGAAADAVDGSQVLAVTDEAVVVDAER